jgi:hypothetical protein
MRRRYHTSARAVCRTARGQMASGWSKCGPSGGVAEWLNALVLKTSRAARLSWVRILPPPPRGTKRYLQSLDGQLRRCPKPPATARNPAAVARSNWDAQASGRHGSAMPGPVAGLRPEELSGIERSDGAPQVSLGKRLNRDRGSASRRMHEHSGGDACAERHSGRDPRSHLCTRTEHRSPVPATDDWEHRSPGTARGRSSRRGAMDAPAVPREAFLHRFVPAARDRRCTLPDSTGTLERYHSTRDAEGER